MAPAPSVLLTSICNPSFSKEFSGLANWNHQADTFLGGKVSIGVSDCLSVEGGGITFDKVMVFFSQLEQMRSALV